MIENVLKTQWTISEVKNYKTDNTDHFMGKYLLSKLVSHQTAESHKVLEEHKDLSQVK